MAPLALTFCWSAGLTSLKILQEISGTFQSPSHVPALRHLSVTAEYWLPEAALTTLLDAAPNLTSLDLHCGGAIYNHSWTHQHNPLTRLGPRLERLSLRNPPPEPEDDSTVGLAHFLATSLPTFVSLRCLEMTSVTAVQLLKVVQQLPTQLLLLETRLAGGREAFRDRELGEVAQSPALSELKRWRMFGLEDRQAERLSWAMECRARGVDLRDERLYSSGERRQISIPRLSLTNLLLFRSLPRGWLGGISLLAFSLLMALILSITDFVR